MQVFLNLQVTRRVACDLLRRQGRISKDEGSAVRLIYRTCSLVVRSMRFQGLDFVLIH